MQPHKPRKRFGQHFLIDPGVIDRILQAIRPRAHEHVVEIGPGQAALTTHLAQHAGRLTLIELDRDLAGALTRQFAGHATVEVVSGDALAFDFGALGTELRIVGNLPYNISTPLLFHIAAAIDAVRDLHFMLQKEVVDRMAATPGQRVYGRLSVMLQRSFAIEPLFDVDRGAFDPPPNVQSAVVRLAPLPREQRLGGRAEFDEVVTQAFSQRRKTLRNSLRALLDERTLAAHDIDAGRRPETLSVQEFDRLAAALAATRGDCA